MSGSEWGTRMNAPDPMENCVGCGADVPRLDTPTHPDIGASPGCGAVCLGAVARAYGEYGYPAFHHRTVDTCALQHPGSLSGHAFRSVGLHLVSLDLAMEKGCKAPAVRRALGEVAARQEQFEWRESPAPPASGMVLELASPGSRPEPGPAVRRWARSVRDSWSGCRETIQRWVER